MNEIWVTIKECSNLIGYSRQAINSHIHKYTHRTVTGNGGKQYQILLSSLPKSAQQKYLQENASTIQAVENKRLADAPDYARKLAEKYSQIITESQGLFGSELDDWVKTWNTTHHDYKTSRTRVYEIRKEVAEFGVDGLLGKWGNRVGVTSVPDVSYGHFRSLYLKQGAPSAQSCWIQVLGAWKQKNATADVTDFPSCRSFVRRLEREIPEQSIVMARYGREYWNRHYGYSIERDRSTLLAGQCYVGDHAQFDVAVVDENGKPCFPWLTAWADFKSNKFVGWYVHSDAPNSDDIFLSFYYAVRDNGLCKHIYIDNGRDYRCRDFAGGRKNHRVEINQPATTAMVTELDITPHLAWVRNAQSKIIERVFGIFRQYHDKHYPGYRGNNVVNKPENLKSEIKSGKILTIQEFTKIFDTFILEVYNEMPSNGVLAGKSPNQVWAEDTSTYIRNRVTDEALKLFCMRTSKPVRISGNGISLDGHRYYAEWMSGCTGSYCYVRRDPKAYQLAYCFDSANDKYIGLAMMAEAISALCTTDIEKDALREQCRVKRHHEKIAKEYIKTQQIPAEQKITDAVAGVAALNEKRGYKPQPVVQNTIALPSTAMDYSAQAIRKDLNKIEDDINALLPDTDDDDKPPIFGWPDEREEWEEKQARKKAKAEAMTNG